MKISLIAAMDVHRLIGNHAQLPWKLPADMRWFRKQTMGKPILMGRKTYESIGKPLLGRTNLILSRRKGLKVNDCIVINSLEKACQCVPETHEIMVVGGAEIYALLLPVAERMYITEINAAFEGDTWFPHFDVTQWQQTFTETHASDDDNPWPYTFSIFDRM